MGNAIFVSYKYGDDSVYKNYGPETTVRDYIDELEKIIDIAEHDYRGEDGDKDLSKLPKEEIRKKLAARISHTTVTIVMISPNMNDGSHERDQWIPWEVSYSIQINKRTDGKSYRNAMLAVVLPDADYSHDYYKEYNTCTGCKTWSLREDKLFPIVVKNMLNTKREPNLCSKCGTTYYSGNDSYIEMVDWQDFYEDANYHIEEALRTKENISDYKIEDKLEKLEDE